MRIGLFTDTYPPFINGVSTSIVMLKKALEKQGHTVYIVTVNNENMTYKYEEDDKEMEEKKENLITEESNKNDNIISMKEIK